MGLDDLFDSDSPGGGRGSRVARRDGTGAQRRRVLASVLVVLMAGILGAAVGALAGARADHAKEVPAALPAVASPPDAQSDIGYLRDPRAGTGGSGEEDAGLRVRMDRVQLLTGQAAVEAARRDGQEAQADYYVVNDNPRLRDLLVRADATVTGGPSFNAWAGDAGSPEPRGRTLDELGRFLATDRGRETLFALRYDGDGFVSAVSETFVP